MTGHSNCKKNPDSAIPKSFLLEAFGVISGKIHQLNKSEK